MVGDVQEDRPPPGPPRLPSRSHRAARLAIEAVFRSWNGKRAVDYRNAAGIPHDLGTASTSCTMVFGNMGDDSATGVAMTRSAHQRRAGNRGRLPDQRPGRRRRRRHPPDTKPIERAPDRRCPKPTEQFAEIAKQLEKHYRNMQDVEFTIERGKLWMLQTRDGKRTAQAEVRIAVDMAEEGLITKKEAVSCVSSRSRSTSTCTRSSIPWPAKRAEKIASGLNVSPGAAVGHDRLRRRHWPRSGPRRRSGR